MPNTARHPLPLLSAGQAQKELTHNEALTLIDAALHASAEAMGLNTPPAAPTAGQCWIAGAVPTGAWAGQPHALACWTEGGWRFLPAGQGMRVWLTADQIWAERTAGGWVAGDVRGERLVIGDVPVVGPRLGSVTPPSGGGTVDAEARAAISLIIARLAEHGLIAS
ncbi:DUF2793 domain-containing protein [Sphingomonas sp.]|jgi:hypothetical protein|uniref:DUF2793 domain-containing protein n=1 Tax=Sphingomonas sp. TaxID=28214 RepID=UPI002DF339EB|nr:DUF2793 domain-containing protein [Sphingomonas sp.]